MDGKTIERRIDIIFKNLKKSGMITAETSRDEINKMICDYFMKCYSQDIEEEARSMVQDPLISTYLNERLAKYVVLVGPSENVINMCLEDFHYHGDLSPLVNSISNFCIYNQDKIDSEYIRNARDFLTDERIRFHVSEEAFLNINKVVELANTLNCNSVEFFKEEDKRFSFGLEEDIDDMIDNSPKTVSEQYIERIRDYEIEVYDLISTALYKKKEDFQIRYCFCAMKYTEYLCIINYLLKDCPYLFKIDKFKECIDYILEESPAINFKAAFKNFMSMPLPIKIIYPRYCVIINKSANKINDDIQKIRS